MSPPSMTSLYPCCPVRESLYAQAVQWECLLPLWRHYTHVVQLENLCMCRLSSENVSSPYDDRLDKTDPTGESNAVRRWACKFLTFYFSYLFNFILVISNCLCGNISNILSLFCFFDVTCICIFSLYVYSSFPCNVHILHLQWIGKGFTQFCRKGNAGEIVKAFINTQFVTFFVE